MVYRSGTKVGEQRVRIREGHIAKLQVPEVFSFLEDPNTALSFVEELQRECVKGYVREIYLDHEGCKSLGLCAQSYMDIVLMDNMERRSRSKSPLIVGGRHSKNTEVNIMLRATGTLRQVKHPHMQLPPEVEKGIVRSELYRSSIKRRDRLIGQRHHLSYELLRRSSERDVAATRLVQYFNRCLNTQGCELNPHGRKYLIDLLTEVIGNCEEHGGRWFTIGYFRESPAKNAGDCHIAMFNFGASMFHSLNSRSSSRAMKDEIAEIAKKHAGGPNWGKDYDEETVWTICALQEGVSRYRDRPGGETRGTGTIEMINAFSQLAGKYERMCIVSGGSYILFDGRFDLKNRELPGGTRKVIAFNDSNDLRHPPDKRNVYKLRSSFPGTMVSVRLSLEQEHLAKLVGGQNGQ